MCRHSDTYSDDWPHQWPDLRSHQWPNDWSNHRPNNWPNHRPNNWSNHRSDYRTDDWSHQWPNDRADCDSDPAVQYVVTSEQASLPSRLPVGLFP